MCCAYAKDSQLPELTYGALDCTAELLAKLLPGSEDPDVTDLSEAVKAKLGITEHLPKPALASASPRLSTLSEDLERARVSTLLLKVTCPSPFRPRARKVFLAELQDMPVTETEKKGLTALAPFAVRSSTPSDPTSGGGKSGKPIAQANIELELPEFDPKNLPEWAEEFAEFLLLTGQSHVDVATKCFLLKPSCKMKFLQKQMTQIVKTVLLGLRFSKDLRNLSRSMKQTSVCAHRLGISLCFLNFLPLRESLNMFATWNTCSHE